MTAMQIILLLMALAQPFDYITTRRAIASGTAHEANPLLVVLASALLRMGAAQWAWLAIAKGGVLAGCVALLVWPPSLPAWSVWLFGGGAAGQWYGVWSNWQVVKRLP